MSPARAAASIANLEITTGVARTRVEDKGLREGEARYTSLARGPEILS